MSFNNNGCITRMLTAAAKAGTEFILNRFQTERAGCAVYVVTAGSRLGLRGAEPLLVQSYHLRGREFQPDKLMMYRFNAMEKVFRTALHANALSSSVADCNPDMGRYRGGIVFQDKTVAVRWWGIGVSGFDAWADELLALCLGTVIKTLSIKDIDTIIQSGGGDLMSEYVEIGRHVIESIALRELVTTA